MSIQGAGKTMKRLAREAHGVVLDSAGEMGRRQRWNFFVKNLPHDHTLLELVPFPLEDALYPISVHLLIIPTQAGIQS